MKVLKKAAFLILALVIVVSMAACKQGAGDSTTTPAPTTTKAPTTTPAPTTTKPTEEEPDIIEPFEVMADSLTTYYSIGENSGWEGAVYTLGSADPYHKGKQYVTFLVTPLVEKVDGSIGFSDFDKVVTGFGDLAIMVRMNADGFFDARNGDNFEKLSDVAYEADSIYTVEIRADMDAKTYTVFITDEAGTTATIAENFSFRTTANDTDDLGKVFFVSAGGNDEFTVDAFKRQRLYEPTYEFWSKGENFGWQQNGARLDTVYRGKVKIEFDMMDNQSGANLNGSVDFTSSEKEVYGFNDLAMLVRVHFDHGCFDARNGDVFAKEASVPCVQDVTYHITVEADLDARTYSYWVTTPEGVTTQIAKDYAFRTTANDVDNIGQVFVVSQHANNQLLMTNLKIEEMN